MMFHWSRVVSIFLAALLFLMPLYFISKNSSIFNLSFSVFVYLPILLFFQSKCALICKIFCF